MDKAAFNLHFGKFVEYKRKQQNWTQVDLASRIGNNFQNISRLERGLISPTLYWLNSLASAFGISMTELISEFEQSLHNKIRLVTN